MSDWSNPNAGDLSSAFDRSRSTASGETLEHIRHNFFMILSSSESDDSTMGGLVINTNGRKGGALQSKEKERRAFYDMILISILDRAQEQLAALDAQLAQRYELLSEKYGEDVIGGMAATYLNEAQLAGLQTEEQQLAALAALFLDENGAINPQYDHLEEAKYVRDWQKAEELRPVVAKYQGRDYLTQEEAREIEAASSRASLSENSSKIRASDNTGYETTVDAEIESNRSGTMDAKVNCGFSFS
ncbi:Uncharacterised protein [Halioglobus japonicus]|nr:Uncharacterised protein [Halioglobus japonicus]